MHLQAFTGVYSRFTAGLHTLTASIPQSTQIGRQNGPDGFRACGSAKVGLLARSPLGLRTAGPFAPGGRKIEAHAEVPLYRSIHTAARSNQNNRPRRLLMCDWSDPVRHKQRRFTMSTPSARDTVLGGIIAVASVSFLMGIIFMLGVQKFAQHDQMWILFLGVLPLLIFAAFLSVRRMLRAVP
jgi:hypothetical protein